MSESVLIIGGGLAGLAAATALAPRGFHVTVLESRNRLGGRAGSFQDAATGQMIDTCQHVSMGCCTNLAQFCRTLGIAHFLEPQACLYFMTPDRRMSRFRSDAWPAPFHLARSFLSAHYLSPMEKVRIAYGLACLRQTTDKDDPPFQDWLDRHWQTPNTVQRFWGLVLVSALNESPERIGLRYARKVFLDGFLRHRRGFEVELPSVPLGRLYGEELLSWLKQHGVELLLQTGGRRLLIEDRHVTGLQLRGTGGSPVTAGEPPAPRDENVLRADWYLSAVPFDRLVDLLPEKVVDDHPSFSNLRRLETSPITSVHVWYDRPVLDLPHVVLIDCIGQWVFNRGTNEAGEDYLQVVVSAARQFRGLGREGVESQVCGELARLFPRAAAARVLRTKVVTEHAATFSAVPGVDRWRPAQKSPLENLFLAGDWTATGWPATMEGAVRSGYLAAEALLRRGGRECSLVQPDLG
jgi:squalene-associated FAD-dependent desaturase